MTRSRSGTLPSVVSWARAKGRASLTGSSNCRPRADRCVRLRVCRVDLRDQGAAQGLPAAARRQLGQARHLGEAGAAGAGDRAAPLHRQPAALVPG
eukprot:1434867-Prymnesium_polylepis.1